MTDQSEPRFGVTISPDGATVSVSVSEDIDASNADQIRAAVMAAAAQDDIGCVLVDLSRVDFMDSSGLAALIVCMRCLHELGLEFGVVGARDGPLRALKLTGVLDLLSSTSVGDAGPQQSESARGFQPPA